MLKDEMFQSVQAPLNNDKQIYLFLMSGSHKGTHLDLNTSQWSFLLANDASVITTT